MMSRPGSERGPRVLVVEDDAAIADNLFTYLNHAGFDVDPAYSGTAALHRCSTAPVDAVVLDLGLPALDGMDVLERLRQELRSAVPVLVVSARADLSDKLAAFERGADDYLTKPFALAEVAARLRALLSRAAGKVIAEPVARFGALELDVRDAAVRVDGRPVHLTHKAAKLLELLMRQPGQLVRRAQIERELWPDAPPRADALRSHVHGLRKALADAGFDSVATVHGLGYRLVDPRLSP